MTRALGRALVAERWSASSFAFAAFNVSNLETGQAIVAAAEQAAAPVFLQVSPGAIAYAGYDALTRLVFDLADAASVPVVVHLDHCRDPAVVRRAIEDGYGSVMFDGSRLPWDDNVRTTAGLVAAARPLGVSVEAELGVIGGIEDSTLEEASAARTSPDAAARFVEATDVDLLAPAIGALHRMPDDSVALDVPYLRAVAQAACRPLALHGGSGVRQHTLPAAIEAGVGKVNISSRVSRAMAAGIRDAWERAPDELDLRRFLGAGRSAVQAMAAEYLALTRSAGRAVPAGVAPTWSSSHEEPE